MLIANWISLSCISNTISKLIKAISITFPHHTIFLAVKVKHFLIFLNILLLRHFHLIAIDFNNFTNKFHTNVIDFLTNKKRVMAIHRKGKFTIDNFLCTKIRIFLIHIPNTLITETAIGNFDNKVNGFSTLIVIKTTNITKGTLHTFGGEISVTSIITIKL